MSTVQRIWKVDGKKPLNPAHIAPTAKEHGWPMSWWGKVNSIACPRGRNYGEAHFLFSADTLADITLGQALNITCEHEDGTTTWRGYYAIKTESITGDSTGAHWVTFADRRWILGKVACNKRYNLRSSSSAYVNRTTNGGTAYTWQQVLNDLWGLLPASVAGSAPTLPTTPTSTPENFVFDGCSAWHAINQVLSMVGYVIGFDPFTGVFTYQDANDTQSGLTTLLNDNTDRIIWKYSPQELPANSYPATVTVTFHPVPGSDATDEPFTPQPETEDYATGLGVSGTSLAIVDTLFAHSGNAAARATRASELGYAVLGLLRPMAYPWGNVYSGVVEFKTGAELTEVIWSSDGSRGMQTIAKYTGDGHLDLVKLNVHLSGDADHYQYQLITDWFGGLAIAVRKDMDGNLLVFPYVVLRDPLAIFTYQRSGDRGYMVYSDGKYYAMQAPCGTNPAPDPTIPPGTTGACCFSKSSPGDYFCEEMTETDCTAAGGQYLGDGVACVDEFTCFNALGS